MISAGPTTSSRARATEAMKKYSVIYGEFTGGAGALAASLILDVEGVEWFDLGIPEAIWSLKIKDFGPIKVTIYSWK